MLDQYLLFRMLDSAGLAETLFELLKPELQQIRLLLVVRRTLAGASLVVAHLEGLPTHLGPAIVGPAIGQPVKLR